MGVLVLVYDHDTRALADKLTDIQHEHEGLITAALHVHLDAHTCLEAIPLRGPARDIRRVANRLLSIKGGALRAARARHRQALAVRPGLRLVDGTGGAVGS